MLNDRAERHDKGPLLAVLHEAGADVSRPAAIRCPFHDDHHASSGIFRGDDGAWRFKCQVPTCAVGGDVYDIRARVRGTTLAQELPRENMKPEKAHPQPDRTWPTLDALAATVPTPTAQYRYANPDTGAVELAVFRIPMPNGGKRFLQASPRGTLWTFTAPPKPWPIYNRARVRAAEQVVVVEGEKCVHKLHDYGIVATTSPGGAGKAAHANWSPLSGKRVVLWPDNDETGIAHMREVARIVGALDPPASVSWIDPADLNLPPKGDAVEFIERCQHPREELAAVLANAESLSAAGEVRAVMEETIAGKRRNLILPWGRLSKITNMLTPATISVVCGTPGCAKSFWMIQAFAHLHEQGVKVDLFELEDDRAYHLQRALVQRCGDSSLFDDEWVRLNPDKARFFHEQHEEFLSSFGRRIHDAPTTPIDHEGILAWLQARCRAGAEVVGIDPITAIQTGARQWQDDQNFMTRARQIIRGTGTRLILVSHPKLGTKGHSELENVAGGAAFQRFSDTVLWLVPHDPPESFSVGTVFGGAAAETANRSIRIRKARKGRGGGWTVAMDFSGKSTSFSELGVVVNQ